MFLRCGGNYVTGTTYNAAAQITQMNFSSGDSDTYSYDPHTRRMTQYKFNVGAGGKAFALRPEGAGGAPSVPVWNFLVAAPDLYTRATQAHRLQRNGSDI